MTLSVVDRHSQMAFVEGAVGLSVETAQLATRNLGADHHALVALLRRLGPGSLRLGGDSVDYSWWTINHERPPVWATRVITPSALIALRGLLVATNWRAILGVNLGHYDPARAASEARVATHILGSRLLGFEVGNEPDSYGASAVGLRARVYNVSDYLKELATYGRAMRSSAPNIRLYGPDLASEAWLSAIASSTTIPLAAVTQHYYPTTYSVTKGDCRGTLVPTAVGLLSSQVRRREDAVLGVLATAARTAHRPSRITETNTTSSCDANGGPATSPVFASALWALDWALRSARAGVSALNFHSNFGLCGPETFSPICAPNRVAAFHGQVAAQPEYYGLLAARELEGGRFVSVHATKASNARDFTAYATTRSDSLTLVIDYFANGTGTSAFRLNAPGYTTATSETLTAPSLRATQGITFGRASFTPAGALRPKTTTVPKIDGTFRVNLRFSSAIVITLRK